MIETANRRKIAVVTSDEVGKPFLGSLHNHADLAFSNEMGIKAALEGAQAVFLWDVALIDEIRAHWDLMKDAQWMHVAVTGVDEMCFDEMRASSLVLTHVSGVYNYAISEYVTSAVINFERNFPRLRFQKERHEWKPFTTSSSQGKNALIIGPGQIGRTCARSLASLGMHVRGVGTHARDNDPDFERIDTFYELEDIIGWAHHVIVCAPLTKDTYHLLDAYMFKQCRPKVHIVNVGRGPIISTTDLVFALNQGIIGGATLDVFEEEPLSPLSPLWDMSNVVITPHIAGEVTGFEEALISQFKENAYRWLRDEPLKYVVDKESGYSLIAK